MGVQKKTPKIFFGVFELNFLITALAVRPALASVLYGLI
jgi:hypothetical protein